MFKKSRTNKQFDLFNSPSDLMCGRESRVYDNPSAWHNKFYREVTCNIDEEIFRPLFAKDREDKKDGRPNAPIRILIAMSILKEGSGCSDESLFENCCFNMLYRRALGMVTLKEQCPSIDSYYIHSDGAYQSEKNREFAEQNGIDFVANGIQGKPSRFDLEQTGNHTLEVTDKQTGEVINAIPVKDDKWKIQVENKDGKKSWRYFGRDRIEKAKTRREVESIPFDKRKKRNNVEATIFQYCFHTRNNKTRYRGLFKHKIQAVARCAWINVRRLLLFDLKMALQRA